MKRIIDGRTYNTETATELGKWSSTDNPETMQHAEYGGSLHQTRHGAYFAVMFDTRAEPWENGYEKLVPLDPEQALRWAEQYLSTAAIEALFGEMPEAGDAEAKLTLRMPEVLRKRLTAAAQKNNQSLNAWIVRCLEHCAGVQDRAP